MRTIETKITHHYRRLWEEINDLGTPENISQFLHNVSLPRAWFHDKKCLDAGCGSGIAVWILQQLGAHYYACDLDRISLQRVHERLGIAYEKLTEASVLALPYSSKQFDFVYCNGVLHHTIDPRKGFAELARVTRVGGILFVSLYGTGGLYHVAVRGARATARVLPYSLADAATSVVLRNRKIPNSFMPAKVSVLDNMYVPIRQTYYEHEIRTWFLEEGFQEIVRTKSTIYDHEKRINRIIHGEGYLQFRGKKS